MASHGSHGVGVSDSSPQRITRRKRVRVLGELFRVTCPLAKMDEEIAFLEGL